MNEQFLIPANTKKSMLIFGVFNTFDLILFIVGVSVSIILLLILPLDNLTISIIALLPGLGCSFLVFPVPNYHNIRTIIQSIWQFYTSRQKFIWKGWCFLNDESSNEGQIYK